MPRYFWLLCVSAASVFHVSAATASDACGLQAATIDLTYDDRGRPIVPVAIGDVETTMLLDTGGAITALEMDFVMDLDLPQAYAGFTMTAVTGETSWLMTVAPSFTLDTIARSELGLMILPGYEYQLSEGESVGILALDLLRDYDLVFDFANDSFQANPPADCAELVDIDDEPSGEGSLLARRSDFLTVLVVLDGMGLNAIIDTGAAFSVVNGDVASSRLGIDLSQPDDRMTEVDNLGGMPVYARRFSRLVVGDLEISNPSLTLYPDFVRETGGTALDGGPMSLPQAIIGMDILRGYQLHVPAGGTNVQITPAQEN